MALKLIRKNIYFKPDSKRVLARFFNVSADRVEKIIARVLKMTKEQKRNTLNQLLRNYASRHRSISAIWEKNCKRALDKLSNEDLLKREFSNIERFLIGAYFTMEYSIESAAFFNPSIVESPDQTQINEGEKRIILSFRATGEGHVSSIVFRSGIIDENLDIHLEEVGRLLEKPKQVKNHRYQKDIFLQKLTQIESPNPEVLEIISAKFPESFTYEELRRFISEIRNDYDIGFSGEMTLNHILWLASSHYEMSYSLDTSISERVIFPISDTEKNGIEDARFVKYINSKDQVTYYATYTAYDGVTIMPKLLSTKDFLSFKVQPMNGKIANKGAALFPRKINGKYAMLCRIDGENNYLAYADDIINWNQELTLMREPEDPWEFVQLGNCGSPIETEHGWIVLTHSVGPMREYTIGASLLDLNDPSKVIGRLKSPLFYPNQDEREGYVPNVVYSCGQIIHNGHLIIPYAMSDYASTYATINVEDLIQTMKSDLNEIKKLKI
ncbi:MAG: glycosidase [Pedobacter sp.]|nr:MAG: glycosidase [Pedobacter sp.]